MMKSKSTKKTLAIGIVPMILTVVMSVVIAPASVSLAATTNYKPLNIDKKAVDMSGNEIESAQPGDRITYEICFENNNDSAVTSVSVVDELPHEAIFIEAHIGSATGVYNVTDNTFTWLYGTLEAGESACLEIVIDVKADTALDTIITNFVWIECNEAKPSSAVLDLSVGVSLLRVDNVSIIPDMLALTDPAKSITATLEFPEGISKSDIDPNDEPELYYQDLSANEFVFIEKGITELSGTENKPAINITFDQSKLMDFLYSTGEYKLRITGKLKSGQTYYGDVVIGIIQDEESSDNVPIDIYMGHIWDYNDPADDSDLTYEFRLRIDVYDLDSISEKYVNSVEFTTPAGKTFQIPKKAGQWSGNIWTSYEFDAEWDWATWQYRAIFTKLADLQVYSDGEYTFNIIYKDGSHDQATVWFAIPGTTDPIPQPTQEPVLTFPMRNMTTESPFTFTWKPCTDANASEVGLQVQELKNGDFKEGYFDVNETEWGPVILTDGSWQADLTFEYWVEDTSQLGNNVFFSFSKSSRSRYDFTVTGYPRTTYEVWGGEIFLDGYYDLEEIQANGYVKLGESDGKTATFSGEYTYYLIATRGQFLLDSIQGSNDSYYSSFESDMEWSNISDVNNLLGPPDGLYAIVGNGSTWNDNDFSGYIAFTNPGDWVGLTVLVGEITPAKEAVEVENLIITPNVLRSNGFGEYITAVIQFPEGITQSDIDLNDQPEFYYQDRNTGEFILIGKGSSPVLSGTENRPTITVYFSRPELMNELMKVSYYGGVNLKIEGKLNEQPYYGFATIHITIFAGD
jgi:uncharacterized repeat protein (TIGR01451 family)